MTTSEYMPYLRIIALYALGIAFNLSLALINLMQGEYAIMFIELFAATIISLMAITICVVKGID